MRVASSPGLVSVVGYGFNVCGFRRERGRRVARREEMLEESVGQAESFGPAEGAHGAVAVVEADKHVGAASIKADLVPVAIIVRITRQQRPAV